MCVHVCMHVKPENKPGCCSLGVPNLSHETASLPGLEHTLQSVVLPDPQGSPWRLVLQAHITILNFMWAQVLMLARQAFYYPGHLPSL